MTDKSEKNATAKKAALKAEKAKPEAKSAAPKAQAKENPVQEKKAPPKSGGTVTLRQVGSPIGRQGYQRATLIGLGLNKLQRTRTLEDTPSVRGMIAKVKHLVEVVSDR